MALEIRHLRLIESIAEHGTMTRASGHLNVSQSALSHQLTELENGVGVSLFRRLPRRMVLTGAGERLLRAARLVLGELREAEMDLAGSAQREEGVLRLTTECYTCYHWLPASLRPFEAQYPKVSVRIVADATRRPIPALLANEVDIAIMAGPVEGARLAMRPLFRDELVVVMHPEHPLADRPFVDAKDFADQHILTYSLPEDQLTVFTKVLKPAGVRPARHSRVELTEAMVEMVKANLGIAVLAQWAVAQWLDSGALKAVRLTETGKFRDWSAVTRNTKHRPEYLDAFLEVLAHHVVPRVCT